VLPGVSDASAPEASGWVLSDSLSVRRGDGAAGDSSDEEESAEEAARRAANEAAAQKGEGCVRMRKP